MVFQGLYPPMVLVEIHPSPDDPDAPRLGSVEDALCVSALRRHSVDAVLNAAYSGCRRDENGRTTKDGEKLGLPGLQPAKTMPKS